MSSKNGGPFSTKGLLAAVASMGAAYLVKKMILSDDSSSSNTRSRSRNSWRYDLDTFLRDHFNTDSRELQGRMKSMFSSADSQWKSSKRRFREEGPQDAVINFVDDLLYKLERDDVFSRSQVNKVKQYLDDNDMFARR